MQVVDGSSIVVDSDVRAKGGASIPARSQINIGLAIAIVLPGDGDVPSPIDPQTRVKLKGVALIVIHPNIPTEGQTAVPTDRRINIRIPTPKIMPSNVNLTMFVHRQARIKLPRRSGVVIDTEVAAESPTAVRTPGKINVLIAFSEVMPGEVDGP